MAIRGIRKKVRRKQFIFLDISHTSSLNIIIFSALHIHVQPKMKFLLNPDYKYNKSKVNRNLIFSIIIAHNRNPEDNDHKKCGLYRSTYLSKSITID